MNESSSWVVPWKALLCDRAIGMEKMDAEKLFARACENVTSCHSAVSHKSLKCFCPINLKHIYSSFSLVPQDSTSAFSLKVMDKLGGALSQTTICELNYFKESGKTCIHHFETYRVTNWRKTAAFIKVSYVRRVFDKPWSKRWPNETHKWWPWKLCRRMYKSAFNKNSAQLKVRPHTFLDVYIFRTREKSANKAWHTFWAGGIKES